MATLTRSLRRLLFWSLGTAAAGIAGLFLPHANSRLDAVPFWIVVTALPLVFGSLTALPAPGAALRGQRLLGHGTLCLAVLATAMMLALIARLGLEWRDNAAWRVISLMTVPVSILAVAAAYGCAMTAGSPGGWGQRLRVCGTAASFLFAALVSAMIVMDSGNRILFKALGGLLLVAFSTGILTGVAHWRQNRLSRGDSRTAPT